MGEEGRTVCRRLPLSQSLSLSLSPSPSLPLYHTQTDNNTHIRTRTNKHHRLRPRCWGLRSRSSSGKQNNFKGFKQFCLQNGSRQGHNLALTAFCVPTAVEGFKCGAVPRGIVFKAHRLLHYSTLGSRVTKKRRRQGGSTVCMTKALVASIESELRKP